MFSTTNEIKFLIEPQITPYRGPLFFARSLESAAGENVITNGGFAFVDTGRKKLLVTCNHVWKTFQEARLVDSRVRMCVCLDEKSPVVFDQRDPIDCDETLDIATFDITPVLAACEGRKFYSLDRNPPPPVKIGNRLVLLAGDCATVGSGRGDLWATRRPESRWKARHESPSVPGSPNPRMTVPENVSVERRAGTPAEDGASGP